MPEWSDGGALCATRGVWHEFKLPNGTPLRVLEDINLAVRPNEVMALLGPSGCGKSTILRILAGLIQPTRGEVDYHGQRLDGLNPGIAIVFQSFALFPWMTVTENVQVVLHAAGLATVNVSVAPVDDAPVILGGPGTIVLAVPEQRTVVTTVHASDVDLPARAVVSFYNK